MVQPSLMDGHFRKGWMQYFRHEAHHVVTPQAFLAFVGDHPRQAAFTLTGEELWEVAMTKKKASGPDSCAWNGIGSLSHSWIVWLALILLQF